MTITLPENEDKSDLTQRRKEFLEKRKKLRALIQSMIENDKTITTNLDKAKKKADKKNASKKERKLSGSQRKLIFNHVLASNSINLFQKIHIFDKFELHGRIASKAEQSYTEYCQEIDSKVEYANILGRMLSLSPKSKFKFAHKYNQSNMQKQQNRRTLDALKRVASSKTEKASKRQTNGVSKHEEPEDSSNHENLPQKPTVQITHVAFCTGEFSHLAIVCTEKRLLIWNLLTLRLQSAFKIEVERITVDVYTSLVAVVSKNNMLWVFLPNTPITLYRQKELPKIDGMAWIPRQYPRNRSLTVDWQAHAELYFLSSHKQVRQIRFCPQQRLKWPIY